MYKWSHTPSWVKPTYYWTMALSVVMIVGLVFLAGITWGTALMIGFLILASGVTHWTWRNTAIEVEVAEEFLRVLGSGRTWRTIPWGNIMSVRSYPFRTSGVYWTKIRPNPGKSVTTRHIILWATPGLKKEEDNIMELMASIGKHIRSRASE